MVMSSALSPIESAPDRLSDRVYEALCEAIIRGELPPGQRLLQAEVAQALNVSRTPVRGAFAKLVHQRMVTADPRGAHFVAEWDRRTLWEVATVRAAVEQLAFSLASQNLSDDDFNYLEGIIEQMEEMEAAEPHGGYKRMAAFDFQFHSYVWSCTSHELLQQILDDLRPQVRYYMYLTRRAAQQHYATHHRELMQFLSRPNGGDAMAIMLDHILLPAQEAIAHWEQRGLHKDEQSSLD